MLTDHILSLLITERDKLNRAIEALQGSRVRRSGQKAAPAAAPNGRRGGVSAQARKAQSARMKAYWAQRRKQAAAKKAK